MDTLYVVYVYRRREQRQEGAKALSDWLRRCRATVEEVKGATFVRLLEMLVESVLLYGVEAWGCGGQLDAVENVQMRATRIFLGVGRRQGDGDFLDFLARRYEHDAICNDVSQPVTGS